MICQILFSSLISILDGRLEKALQGSSNQEPEPTETAITNTEGELQGVGK
jgi:hypothetical protein